MTFKRALNLDQRVFCISAILVSATLDIAGYININNFITSILHEGITGLMGGDKEFHFYKHLIPFAYGRLNEIQARILELCIVANIRKDMNLFRNAFDIVAGILEVEKCRIMKDEIFGHSNKPDAILRSSVI